MQTDNHDTGPTPSAVMRALECLLSELECSADDTRHDGRPDHADGIQEAAESLREFIVETFTPGPSSPPVPLRERDAFVDRVTRWLMPRDEALAAESRTSMGLDGIYAGKSRRIRRMLRLAFARGCRRGASAAWAALQRVSTRGASDPASSPALTSVDLTDGEIRAVSCAAMGRPPGLWGWSQVPSDITEDYASGLKKLDQALEGRPYHPLAHESVHHAIELANATLHPNGRCRCCGEGTCEWCTRMAAEMDAETEEDEG